MRIRYIAISALLALAICAAGPVMADNVTSAAKMKADEWDEYCKQFLDIDTNEGYTATACSMTADGKTPDGDLDVEALFRPTIPVDDPDTYTAISRLMLRIAQPEVKEAPPADTLDAVQVQERILVQQHVNGARGIAYHTLSDLIARRSPVGPTEKELEAASKALPRPPVGGTVQTSPVPAPSPPPDPVGPAAKFDIAVGDGIANVLQKRGHMGGGQCPDNAKQFCHFYLCDTTRNLKGSTCVGRDATGVMATITDMGAAAFSGKNVLLSSGLSNQASDCSGGTSGILSSQLAALSGAAHVIVVGAYRGQTRGENPVDLTAVDTCIKNTVSASGGNAVYLDGFTSSYDHYKPADPADYLLQAEGTLKTAGGTPSGSGNISGGGGVTCEDGSLGPPC
jgi:hypothetical protein